jgi:DNA-directed RNA polymerases I, II, and III subunit RPABC2|tara:strand:+ start:433 stop:741 length:309 start_codon:yes stop_codon:yes gene_type:complete
MSSNIITEPTFVDNNDFLKNYHTLKLSNVTTNKLSKYERTAVLGIRATQLSMGAQPFIDPPKYMTCVVEIAELELDKHKTPFIIERDLNTKKEYWKIEDMIV